MRKSPTIFVDLDGTLTRTELLPEVAARVGLDEELRRLTDLTLTGEIPFDASFRTRVAMLADVPPSVIHEAILEAPIFEEFMGLLLEHPERVVVVTGNLDIWVQPFLDRFGLRGLTSTARLTQGRLTGVEKVLNKSTALAQYPAPFSIAIGDGANDAPLVRNADVGIAWCGVHLAAAPLMEVADVAFAREEKLCQFLRQWW